VQVPRSSPTQHAKAGRAGDHHKARQKPNKPNTFDLPTPLARSTCLLAGRLLAILSLPACIRAVFRIRAHVHSRAHLKPFAACLARAVGVVFSNGRSKLKPKRGDEANRLEADSQVQSVLVGPKQDRAWQDAAPHFASSVPTGQRALRGASMRAAASIACSITGAWLLETLK
jgi:hypothetical protein